MLRQFGLLLTAILCVTVTRAINCNCELEPEDELRQILNNELNVFNPGQSVLFQSNQALLKAPDSITITKNGPSGRFSKIISTAIQGNTKAQPRILVESPAADSLIMKQRLFDNFESRTNPKVYSIRETPDIVASTLKENLLNVLRAATAFQKVQQQKLLLNEASNFDAQKELVPIALALVEQLSNAKSTGKLLIAAGQSSRTQSQNPAVLNTFNPQFLTLSRPAVTKAIAEAIYENLVSAPEQIVKYGYPRQRIEVAGNINVPSKKIASFEESIYDILQSNANDKFQPSQLTQVILERNGKAPAFVEKEDSNIYANIKSKAQQRMTSQLANTIVNNVQQGQTAQLQE